MKSAYVLDPRNSRYMPYWDVVMLNALTFVALVTPFETAFLEERRIDDLDPLFFINRLVDFAFFIDMILCFNLSYQETQAKGACERLARALERCTPGSCDPDRVRSRPPLSVGR